MGLKERITRAILEGLRRAARKAKTQEEIERARQRRARLVEAVKKNLNDAANETPDTPD